jgi:hypothetical protein
MTDQPWSKSSYHRRNGYDPNLVSIAWEIGEVLEPTTAREKTPAVSFASISKRALLYSGPRAWRTRFLFRLQYWLFSSATDLCAANRNERCCELSSKIVKSDDNFIARRN